CPWESMDMEQHPGKAQTRSPALPKSPSSKSQSLESLKAEICPWEAPEAESTDKAEICPWDVATALPEKGAAPGKGKHPPKEAGASKALEKRSSQHEAIFPWESLAMEKSSQKSTPEKELPK
ncbi:GP179 protein, partial [Bucco capensis]|nr:GP179 protein [Bucco capensis]